MNYVTMINYVLQTWELLEKNQAMLILGDD